MLICQEDPETVTKQARTAALCQKAQTPFQTVQGVLRIRSREYGGSWVPAFVSSQQRKNSEVYWPVSLTLTQLTCIVCTATQPIPQVGFRAAQDATSQSQPTHSASLKVKVQNMPEPCSHALLQCV